jgi:hypothetical protein
MVFSICPGALPDRGRAYAAGRAQQRDLQNQFSDGGPESTVKARAMQV